MSFRIIYNEYAYKTKIGVNLFKFLTICWSLYGVAALADIKTKNIVEYVNKKVVFSINFGTTQSKYRNNTETIIPYVGTLFRTTSKENFFLAKNTPNVK